MRKLFFLLMAVVACSWSLVAQNRTISGTVVDASNNEPLIGATVMPIGGGQGTSCDIDGKFTLSVPANVKKAKVSYVGYKTQEVTLTNGMKISLYSESTSLDDVVVVAYGTANKESLTGSVAVVGAKEIEERPVTSATAALEGNAPGVQVNNTVGNPGTSPAIRIRGFNTLQTDAAATAVLIVVDGIEYNGSIADINPNDIESMSVLKDAASSALYGAKGANGVILITTKKAKQAGKIDVNVQISQGIYQLGLPLYDRLGPNDWMQQQFYSNVNGSVSAEVYPTVDAARAYYVENFINAYAKNNIYGVPNNQLFDADGKFFGGQHLPSYTDLDWWDAVTQNGHRQEYNINAAGATEKFNIFASVGYLKENGYMLATDFERYTARINANFNPTDYFRFGLILSGVQQESEQNANAGDTNTENPFGVLNNAPIYPYYAHDAEGNIVYDADGNPEWNTAGYLAGSNPAWAMRLNKSNYSVTALDATLYGTAVIPYGFELTVRGNIHRDKTNMYDYSSKKFGSALGSGLLTVEFDDFRSHQFMQSLYWSHDYGNHHVDVLLNHENYDLKTEGTYLMNSEELVSGVYNINNFSEYMGSGGSIAQARTEAYLGRARYNYDQKYFAEFSLRRDGTSRFAKDHRWGTFWSVGASWVISKEKFMQNINWINYLKLRAAYGSVGNCNAAGVYSSYSVYRLGTMGVGSTIPALLPSSIANPDLKWEATKTFDIGLEGSLFNDRLNFSIGYFDKRNADLLYSVTMPASIGMLGNSGSNPATMQNIGTMSNRGWELSFNGTIMRNKDINWTASIDATFLDNKIVKMPDGRAIEGATSIRIEGRSLYEMYLYDFAGVDQLTGQSLYRINPEAYEFWPRNDMSVRYYDADKVKTAFEQRIEEARAAGELVEYNGEYYTTNAANYATQDFFGSAIPTVYGSFGTNFSWKGLRLGLLFTYSLGGHTLDSVYAGYMSTSGTGALHKDILKSWTAAPEGMTEDSPNRIDPNGIPQVNSFRTGLNNATSSRWLTKADYLVFKNLNISYDLPSKWTDAMKMQGLTIGMSVDNLFTVTARKGMNPQQSWSGSQSQYFGTARVYSFQLTARF